MPSRTLRLAGAGLAVSMALSSAPSAEGAFHFVGNRSGGDGVSFFQESNWDDDGIYPPYTQPAADSVNHTAQTPVGVTADLVMAVGDSGICGGTSGVSYTIQLNGHTLAMTAGGIRHAVGAASINVVRNDAAAGGERTTVTVGGDAFLTTMGLQDVEATVSAQGMIFLAATTSTGVTAPNALNNASVNLVGPDARLHLTRLTADADILAAVAGKVLVNGTPLVLGADLFAAEPGDNAVCSFQEYTGNSGAWGVNFPLNAYATTAGVMIQPLGGPQLTSFTASPALVASGGSATLSWTAAGDLDGATFVIAPGVGDVTAQTTAGSGSVTVQPVATTTYTLQLTAAGGSDSRTVEVAVGTPTPGTLVINEVLAHNDGGLADEDGSAQDWIELRNPGVEPVVASGWRLRDGATGSGWRLPAGVTVPAGGYLVIFASGKNRTDPARPLHADFSLKREGELLQLIAPTGAVADAMPADVVFPTNVSWGRVQDGATATWLAAPTPGAKNSAAGNPGPIIWSVDAFPDVGVVETQRPTLEDGPLVADSAADFGGVQGHNGWSYGWSTAAVTAYVPAGFTPFPGGAAGGAWNATTQNFNPANTTWGPKWERNLTTVPFTDIGLDYTYPNVTGGLNSAVRRWTSTVSGPVVLSGFFHHIGTGGDGTRWQLFHNGTPLVDGDPAAAGVQPTTVKTALRRFGLPVVLAVGDQIDLVCDPNATDASDGSRGGLRITLQNETTPLHTASIPVSARVQALTGTPASVTLFHRVDFLPEQSTPMVEDGGVWRADIPLAGVWAGQLVRWRVVATDSAGGTSKQPPYPSATDSPQYEGTVCGGSGGKLFLFAANPAQLDTAGGGRASLFWDGTLYDNVHVDLHASSSSSYAKKSWDVDFNRGHRFHFTRQGHGHTDINLLTNWRDRAKWRNPLAYSVFGASGHPTLPCQPVRVELNGVFHSIMDITGEGGEGVLEDNGLDPDGALYKMQNLFRTYPTDATSAVEKRTRKREAGNADLQALLQGLTSLSTTNDNAANSPRFRFVTDQTDVSATVNFIAAMFMSTSYDWGHKNYFLYRDSNHTGRWFPIPWDLDLSFGHFYDSATNGYFDDVIRTNTNDGSIHNFSLFHNQYEFTPPNKNSLFTFYLEDATLRAMVQQRIRTLADTLLTPTRSAHFEDKIDAWMAELDPPDAAESDADRDLRIWGYWNQHTSGSFTYVSRSAAEETARVKDIFLPARRGMLFQNSPALGAAYGGPIPPSQPSAPDVAFGAWSNEGEGEYIEVVNQSSAWLDMSGWRLTGGVEFTFPPGTVLSPAGNSRFDGRVVVVRSVAGWRARTASPRDGEGRHVLFSYDGQLSGRGETVLLQNGALTLASLTVPPAPTPAQLQLRLTEVNYNPPPPTPAELAVDGSLTAQDFEFVELMNIGTTPLDLSGTRFTDGITFAFPAGTVLPPGGFAIVAKDPVAFAIRHGAANGAQIFGGYPDNLRNNGERLTVTDAAGENAFSIVYDGNWFAWGAVVDPSDGGGRTLEFSDPWLPDTELDDSGAWRLSGALGGSPGAVATTFAWNYAQWQRIHFTDDERSEPQLSGPLARSSLGVPNLVLHALGLPRGATSGLPEVVRVDDAGNSWPAIRFRQRKNRLDATVTVQTATTLTGWHASTVQVGPAADHGDGTETVTFRATVPDAPGQARFFRVVVTL